MVWGKDVESSKIRKSKIKQFVILIFFNGPVSKKDFEVDFCKSVFQRFCSRRGGGNVQSTFQI